MSNERNEPDPSLNNHIWEAQRLRFATEAAGVALWSWDVDNDKIILDDRAFDLWGLQPAPSVTFEKLSSKIHPEDLDKVRASFAATRERFGSYETDFRLLLGKEVRWISARGKGDDHGIIGRIMYGVFIDVTVRKRAEEARELIAAELNHRVKNLFALASALTRIALRSTDTKEEMADDLMQRLTALYEAHALIRPDINAQSKARELRELLAVLLKPYLHVDGNDTRVKVNLPDLLVGERSATSVAMIVHELVTNSMKYGALSLPTGLLTISGQDKGDVVEITWVENGTLSLSRPEHEGFGTRLIRANVEDQLGGTFAIDWEAQGMTVKVELNKARLGA